MTRKFVAAYLGIPVVCISIAGCAGVSVRTVPGTTPKEIEANDKKIDGIRYYEQVPFLLIYSDAKGGLKSELVYLPDTTRTKVVDPYAWLANNNATLTFDKGVLTSSKQVVDETVVPKALIEAAKTAVMASFDVAKKNTGQVPPPALFRLWVNKDGSMELIGDYARNVAGTERENIHVTVSQPAEKKPEGKPADNKPAEN